jgi:hypothetical protein
MDMQNGILGRIDPDGAVRADACADADPEVHRVLVDTVFPRQAEVTRVAAWAATLAG